MGNNNWRPTIDDDSEPEKFVPEFYEAEFVR